MEDATIIALKNKHGNYSDKDGYHEDVSRKPW